MSKPNWNDAPEWAEALGQDESGDWHWFPHFNPNDRDEDEWMLDTTSSTIYKIAGHSAVFGDWRENLERRPCDDQKTKNPDNHDDVKNPKHYDLFPDSQSIDIIRAALSPEEWQGFLKGNVLKYRLRAGEKGPADRCLAKANWYRDRLWGEHENKG